MPLEFLDGDDTPQSTTPVLNAEPADDQGGPVRGPDGRFAAKEAEAAATTAEGAEGQLAPQVAEVVTPAVQPEPAHIPISAMLDEREKRQAAERRAQEAEERAQRLQAEREQQRPAAIPDPIDDPEGFAGYQQALALNMRLDVSEDLARAKYGDDVVNELQAWAAKRFAASPAYQQEVNSNRNPYEFAMQAFTREKLYAEVSASDLAEFKAWKAAQAAGQVATNPAPAAPAAPQNIAPPRSIASLSSAGHSKPGEAPVGPGVSFDATFER